MVGLAQESVDQNVKSGNINTNRTRIIQKNSLPTSRALNVTALNLPINGTTKINPENGNADVSSPFGSRNAISSCCNVPRYSKFSDH